MVCESCITKLGKIIVPDKWKDGSRNNLGNFIIIYVINKIYFLKNNYNIYIYSCINIIIIII